MIYMLIGLSGSGKSTYAKELKNELVSRDLACNIVSSDAIRGVLYGDEGIQKDHGKVFKILREHIEKSVCTGKSVIVDATNLTIKTRKPILDLAKRLGAPVRGIVFVTALEDCVEQDKRRNRTVGKEVVYLQAKKFQIPLENEGFESIEFKTKDIQDRSFILLEMKDFDQKTKWHKLSLDQHCDKAKEYVVDRCCSKETMVAASLHDIGKPFSQSFDEEGQAHYYGHESIGAYQYLVYQSPNKADLFALQVARLINYHMLPYHWSSKTEEKYRNLMGEELFQELMIIHEADKSAH